MDARELLSSAATLLLGESWQRALARKLEVDDRLMRRWSAGDRPVPGWVLVRLAELLEESSRDSGALAEELRTLTAGRAYGRNGALAAKKVGAQSKGGKATAKALTPEERAEKGRRGARKRWDRTTPEERSAFARHRVQKRWEKVGVSPGDTTTGETAAPLTEGAEVFEEAVANDGADRRAESTARHKARSKPKPAAHG